MNNKKREVMSRVFLVVFLGMILISMIGVVLADDGFGEPVFDNTVSSNTFLSDNVFGPIKDFLNNYIIPENYFGTQMSNTWFIVSLLGMIIFYLIIYEIMTTVSPLSTYINVLIVIFVSIILTMLGFVRDTVGVLMVWIVTLTGIGGAFGMIMLGVIFLAGAIAIFWGNQFLHQWIDKIKFNKEMQKKTKKAYSAAANISALNAEAAHVRYRP